MKDKVEFEKSAVKVWLLALLGVPFLLIGADLFFEQKLIGRFGDLVYGSEELPAFEPRDTILAGLFIVVGSVLVLWGLKELLFPKKVLVADSEGIRLAVAGPFRPSVLIPWESIEDVEFVVVDDEGESRPSVRVEISGTSVLPEYPWGARWEAAGRLRMDATDWSPAADGIVESLWRLRQSSPQIGEE
jgi:hypothetical protein